VEKWTESLLKDGGMENMYVLWTIKELQRKGYGHKDRVSFLEVFNDLLKEELEATMRRVSEEMKRFQCKVESFMQIDEE
jgi:hypothetical protein